MDELHKSLKSEVIQKMGTGFGEIALAKQAWSKTEFQYSVHIDPNSFSTYGLQWPDFLNYLGFAKSNCSFLTSKKCFSKKVNDTFDIDLFKEVASSAYQKLLTAQTKLGNCGFNLNQPEGWSYFFGRSNQRSSTRNRYFGDGHTSSITPEKVKELEDENFTFLLTWAKNNESDKGWTIHYRPKHLPVSYEMSAIFSFLDINEFENCAQFDFERCYWRYIPFEGTGPWGSNADLANRIFEAHPESFSIGIQNLLEAQSKVEQAGMGFLNFPQKEERIEKEISSRIQEQHQPNDSISVTEFDLAMSFAGSERKYAEEIAQKLRAKGFSVFYDYFFQDQLWGKPLTEFFHDIYGKRSRFCLIFVSNEYMNREWTIHERRSAQEQMLKRKGEEYILPVKIDDSELPGLPSTIGYVSINEGIDKIVQLLEKKLSTSE